MKHAINTNTKDMQILRRKYTLRACKTMLFKKAENNRIPKVKYRLNQILKKKKSGKAQEIAPPPYNHKEHKNQKPQKAQTK